MSKDMNKYIDEFITTFAESGVVFSKEEVEIIFSVYTQKLSNLIDKMEETK